MWSLNHVSATVATSVEFNFSPFESFVVFETRHLTFVFIMSGKSHFTDGTCVALVMLTFGGLAKVAGRVDTCRHPKKTPTGRLM